MGKALHWSQIISFQTLLVGLFFSKNSDLVIFNINRPNLVVGFKKYAKTKFPKMHTERVGNLLNLVICCQDGSVEGCDHSVLVLLAAWNQAAKSYACPPQSLQNLWSGVQTEALSLHGGIVHPGEGGGVKVDGGFHLEKLPETLSCLNLSRSKGAPGYPIQNAPWPGPYKTTNKLKLCHFFYFLLAPL